MTEKIKLQKLQLKNVIFVIRFVDMSMTQLVYFDLETTGLIETDPDILQIGAITADCSDSFDKFIHPVNKV